MQCPFCRVDKDRVVDSRLIGAGTSIRRRRECLACMRRFTTYERIETAPRIVLKKDSRREFFSREKILGGLTKACEKRNISPETLVGIVDRIESEVFEKCDREVATRVIGEMVSAYLRALDAVAFVRFASVYNEFSEAEQFRRACEDLQRDDFEPNLGELSLPGKGGNGTRHS